MRKEDVKVGARVINNPTAALGIIESIYDFIVIKYDKHHTFTDNKKCCSYGKLAVESLFDLYLIDDAS